ncbi:MAG TPA: hypothetical protein VEV38_14540 [Candidatus Eremiobacteraceae bacterium]|nr:hypothetical protein [Candidatus Eremiobacteraceae bacterium]
MGSATRHRPALIEVAAASLAILCAACSGGGGGSSSEGADVQSSSAAATATSGTTTKESSSGAGGSTAGARPGRQLVLLTQQGIDEDIGYMQGATDFYDCERKGDVGLLSPHTLVPVGYSGCGAGSALLEYVKTHSGISDRSDVTTLVKLGLSKSPDSVEKMQTILLRSPAIDAAHADLVATKIHAIARSSHQ